MDYIKEFTPKKIIQVISYPLFPTHLRYAERKTMPDKYAKVSGQSVYSGMHHTKRAPLIREMHRYYKNHFKWEEMKSIQEYPIMVGTILKVPKNYGDVARRLKKGTHYIAWNPPKDDYTLTWDVGNYGWIYSKGFLDTLKLMGKIVDDNAHYIRMEGGFKWIPCNTLEERELIFIIFKI